jgi:hypothetical protein
MLTVKKTLKMSIARDELDVNRLEEALAEAFEEFEKRVMRNALEEMEKGALEEEKGRW